MTHALIHVLDVQERERDCGVGLNDFFNTLLSKSHKDGETPIRSALAIF